MRRRNFLQSTAMLSLSPMVPCFVSTLARQTQPVGDSSILVVVEMSGGNDGLNTVVPFKDPEYKKSRPKLALDSKRLHEINDEMAFHPSMRRCKELFDDGSLKVVNGVGYPNPSRSHFESIAIWHQGLRNSKRASGVGWLGNALDISRKPGSTVMDGYFVGSEAVSPALLSRRAQIAALSRLEELKLDKSIQLKSKTKPEEDIFSFVQRQMTSAYMTSKQIDEISKPRNTGGYSDSKIAQQLRLISRLIKSGAAARIYYTVQNGYDTHAAQANSHATLLSQYSSAVKAFVDDMKANQLDDRVVVLAFSEFGRRVTENASSGTDHGTAGPLFLTGTKVSGGFLGETTSLTDVDSDVLKTQFDFRSVYATVLEQWLKIDSKKVLQAQFDQLPLFES